MPGTTTMIQTKDGTCFEIKNPSILRLSKYLSATLEEGVEEEDIPMLSCIDGNVFELILEFMEYYSISQDLNEEALEDKENIRYLINKREIDSFTDILMPIKLIFTEREKFEKTCDMKQIWYVKYMDKIEGEELIERIIKACDFLDIDVMVKLFCIKMAMIWRKKRN